MLSLVELMSLNLTIQFLIFEAVDAGVQKKEESASAISETRREAFRCNGFDRLLEYSASSLSHIITPPHDCSPTNPSSTADTADPFARDSRDEALFVTDVPPSHSLLLNKYRSLDQHVRYEAMQPSIAKKDHVVSHALVQTEHLPACLPACLPARPYHTHFLSDFQDSHADGNTHPCICFTLSLLFVLIHGFAFDSMRHFRLCS